MGDYLLQTSKMATEKSQSIKWLLVHVLIYTLSILIFANFAFSWQIALGYALINGLLHLVTDFFTSKLSARYLEQPRIFFPILGFDQMIHMACLYWTFLNADLLAL